MADDWRTTGGRIFAKADNRSPNARSYLLDVRKGGAAARRRLPHPPVTNCRGRTSRGDREPGGVGWVNVAGLAFDIVGATVLSFGLFLSKAEAIELGLGAGLAGETDEENLRLPAVQDRLRQSRNAKIGLALLVLGFGLQIVAAWP